MKDQIIYLLNMLIGEAPTEVVSAIMSRLSAFSTEEEVGDAVYRYLRDKNLISTNADE